MIRPVCPYCNRQVTMNQSVFREHDAISGQCDGSGRRAVSMNSSGRALLMGFGTTQKESDLYDIAMPLRGRKVLIQARGKNYSGVLEKVSLHSLYVIVDGDSVYVLLDDIHTIKAA